MNPDSKDSPPFKTAFDPQFESDMLDIESFLTKVSSNSLKIEDQDSFYSESPILIFLQQRVLQSDVTHLVSEVTFEQMQFHGCTDGTPIDDLYCLAENLEDIQ